MAGPVPTYLTTQTATQTAFTVPFGLLTLVNGAITTATAAGQFNTTVDCSLFTTEDVSNVRIYLDSLGYFVEFAKGGGEKTLLIDWGKPPDIDNGSTIVTQGTTPWAVAIDQTGDNNDVDVIATVLAPNAATESTLLAAKTDLDKFQFDGSGNLKVNVELETPETVTVVQPTGTNLHTVVDSGTITANLGTIADVATQTTLAEVEEDLDQLTFASTRLVVDGSQVTQPVSGTFFQATQPISGTVTANQGTAGASPWPIAIDQTGDNNDVDVINGSGASAVNVQDGGNSITVDGTITADAGIGNFTVVQPTGTNLHTVLDSGTLTSITNALPAGTNVIGHVIADSGSTTVVTGNVTVVQPTGTNLHTVVDSGNIIVTTASNARTDNYTGVATGVTVDVSATTPKTYAIQVTGVGATPTLWNVVLEGSLDNSSFTNLLTSTQAASNGAIVFSGATLTPCLFFRSRVVSLTLGSATSINVKIVGVV